MASLCFPYEGVQHLQVPAHLPALENYRNIQGEEEEGLVNLIK